MEPNDCKIEQLVIILVNQGQYFVIKLSLATGVFHCHQALMIYYIGLSLQNHAANNVVRMMLC